MLSPTYMYSIPYACWFMFTELLADARDAAVAFVYTRLVLPL